MRGAPRGAARSVDRSISSNYQAQSTGVNRNRLQLSPPGSRGVGSGIASFPRGECEVLRSVRAGVLARNPVPVRPRHIAAIVNH